MLGRLKEGERLDCCCGGGENEGDGEGAKGLFVLSNIINYLRI